MTVKIWFGWLVEIEKRQLALQFRRYVALFTIDASQ